MRPLRLLLAAVLATAASPAVGQASRPVTIEAVLGQESLGQVRIGPGGRWIVVERRAAWSAAATYRFGLMTTHLLSGLEIHDAASDAAPRVLADPGHATGYVSGPFSPDGERMLVFRLTETSWRLGVLTLATGETRWFRLTPEFTGLGRTVAWRSATEVIAIARETDDLPLVFRLGGQTQSRKTALWRRFETGHAPSAVAIPSGAYRDERESAAPSRLVRLDVDAATQTDLAVGALFDFELSPDGAAAAVLADAEDLQADEEALVRVGTPARRRRLLLVDIDGRRVDEPLPDEDFLSHLLSWSPDGRAVLAFGRSAGQAWSDGRFWRIPRAGPARSLPLGDARPWVSEQAHGMPLARGGWDGETPVVQVRAVDGGRAWRRVAPNPLTISAREPSERLLQIGGQAWLERRDGLHSLDASADDIGLSGRLHGRERAADGGGRARANPADAQPESGVLLQANCLARLADPQSRLCLPHLGPDDSLVAASPDRRFVVVQSLSATGSTRLLRREAGGDHPLATLNLALDRLDWGRIEAVTHPGPDGQTLTSWLLLPPNGSGVGPAPLAVILYPGAAYPAPPSWLRPGGERRHINPAVLAAHGYAVLVPSLPRPPSGAALDDLAERIGAIVDAAARRAPVDPARVALVGHSYGGHAALLAAAGSDRFRAVAASAGYADLSRVYALTPHFLVSPDDGVPINALAGWAETGQGAIGASLPARPAAYVANSPVYLADRIRTPVLLIEGDLDPAGGEVLFGALYRLGRDAGLVTYAGEGHVFVSPANLRDLHARILAWLDRYLETASDG
ncbi:MAG: alpha/beta hydrolase family protein [Brevundimonas sp.]